MFRKYFFSGINCICINFTSENETHTEKQNLYIFLFSIGLSRRCSRMWKSSPWNNTKEMNECKQQQKKIAFHMNIHAWEIMPPLGVHHTAKWWKKKIPKCNTKKKKIRFCFPCSLKRIQCTASCSWTSFIIFCFCLPSLAGRKTNLLWKILVVADEIIRHSKSVVSSNGIPLNSTALSLIPAQNWIWIKCQILNFSLDSLCVCVCVCYCRLDNATWQNFDIRESYRDWR